MLKNFNTWIFIALAGTVAGMNYIHWKGIQESNLKINQLRVPYQRQIILAHLATDMGDYRHSSALFRKFSNAEIDAAKSKLRSEIDGGIQQLNQLYPSDSERAQAATIHEHMDELLKLSAHLEPMLFLKDAYQKPEIQALHESILKGLATMEKASNQKAAQLYSNSVAADPSVKILEFLSALTLILVTLLLLRDHLTYSRPLGKLRGYAKTLRAEKTSVLGRPRLPNVYHEILDAMESLVQVVEAHSKERHKFIKDIVSDLKTPLKMLRFGNKSQLSSGSGGTPTGYDSANPEASPYSEQNPDRTKMGIALLSGSLDDLTDVVEISRLEQRLEERVIDLCEAVADVSRQLDASPGLNEVKFNVPAIPIWIKLDVRRFERVLFHLVSKMASHLQGGNHRIRISVEQEPASGYAGVEIWIQDEDLERGAAAANKFRNYTGPEQDLLRHWTAEDGFSLTLAHKIIKAHGGSISAAGIVGTSFHFVIRLPRTRILSGGLISQPDQQNIYSPGSSHTGQASSPGSSDPDFQFRGPRPS